MAKYTKTFTSSNYQMRAFQLLGLLCISLSLVPRSCNAAEFTIGGSKGWSIPTDPKALSYNQWAEKNRFQIGDSIGKFMTIYIHVFSDKDHFFFFPYLHACSFYFQSNFLQKKLKKTACHLYNKLLFQENKHVS